MQCGTPLTKDGLLSMGAVKLFQDGSLQGYTGYLSNPYHSLPDAISDGSWRGYPIYNPRELVNIVTRYHEEGWQVAIHGNGDAGIEDILNAFEEAQKAYPGPTRGTSSSIARPSARISSTASNGSAWFRPSSPYTPITGATAIGTSSSGKPAQPGSIRCGAP